MTIAEILRTTSIEILIRNEKQNHSPMKFNRCNVHETDPVVPIVMHREYFLVHPHIDDRRYDNFVHLLIAHKYEISPEGNARYNHRPHDAREHKRFR